MKALVVKKNNELVESFKPSYVWPNPAFHFREYYSSNKCRIFIIENIAHNWKWLKAYCDKFRKTDYFLVQLGWYFDDYLVNECEKIFELLGLDKNKFYFLYPDYAAKTLFSYFGFRGEIVNHNSFLDESFFSIKDSEKKYDAVYTARRAPFKRHHLASQVDNLALVVGDNSGASIEELPPHSYLNDHHLSSGEVIDVLSKSKVGLILSEFEGACYSSSEYLLCGIPVVSTRSFGGRDIWYNSYNSIICDSNPDAVSAAVRQLGSYKRDPYRIRDMHINLALELRENFKKILSEIFSESGVSGTAEAYWSANYKHKMITSETPDFESIF